MEFFIRKNSTEPILKMQLVQDGRSDFDSFYQKLVNSAISFSMKDTKNGAFVILNKAAGIVSKTNVDILSPIEYYIYYRWQPSDVSEVGRYQGQFNISLIDDCSDLIVPVREDLYINITDSFVNSSCDC
jgi:hypothetical protein|tara:strand:- start:8931 stop:9317 length:387 start_codon:yes stop_codon:yes gene_type:complete